MSAAQDRWEQEIIDRVVPVNHAYRKLNNLIDFVELVKPLELKYSHLGQPGISAIRGFKAMLLQFWEDYSDRQMEKAVAENMAIRWFVGFSLQEKTPDHTYFTKFRSRIGTKLLADIFNKINDLLHQKKMFGNVFTFIDASTIVSKTSLWAERDAAIKDGHEKLNNMVIKDYAADTEARWGAKSKHNIWFGYKRHTAVDMRYGLISKTTVTPANVQDYAVVEQIAPNQGQVLMDKLYDTKNTNLKIIGSNCALGTIKKNNNPLKDHDLDYWRSRLRMPFEATFSKLSKRARHKGLVKNVFQNFAQSLCFNLKKAINITPNSAYSF